MPRREAVRVSRASDDDEEGGPSKWYGLVASEESFTSMRDKLSCKPSEAFQAVMGFAATVENLRSALKVLYPGIKPAVL